MDGPGAFPSLSYTKNLIFFPKPMDEKLTDFLQEMKAYGLQKNIPNVSEQVGLFLNMLIRLRRPKTILEIGSANGYSTLWMAEAAREVKATILTLEKSLPSFGKLEENLRRTGYGDCVQARFGEAVEILSALPPESKFDFAFVDGEKAHYLDFWHVLKLRLAPRAVVIFDDMLAFPQKTQAFSQHLKTLSGFQQLLLPIDGEDGVLLLVKE